MTGERDQVQVIDHGELRRPFIVRPAYRLDPVRPINWRGLAEGVAVWIIAPPVLWALIILGLVGLVGWVHALLPSVR